MSTDNSEQFIRFGEAIADRNGVVVTMRGNHVYGLTEEQWLEPARPYTAELLAHFDRRSFSTAPHTIVELFARAPVPA